MHENEIYRSLSNIFVKTIREADQKKRIADWSKSMSYSKLIIQYQDKISFPAVKDYRIDSPPKLSLLNAAAEEQLFTLRDRAEHGSRLCRMGCGVDETAYHVATSCQFSTYNGRHDQVVYWLL